MRCFLTGPATVDWGGLGRLIEQLDIEVVRPDRLPSYASLVRTVMQTVRSSDCLVAVLPNGSAPPAVLLEIGMAVAAVVPVLLLVGEEAAIDPALSEFPMVRLRRDTAPDALAMHILQFARRASRLRETRRSEGEPEPAWWPGAVHENPAGYHASQSGLPPEELLGLLRTPDLAEARLGEVVATLLRAHGDMVHPVPEGAAADLVVWMSDLEGSALNPMVVEIKRAQLDPMGQTPGLMSAAVGLGVSQLRFALEATGAGCGLLLAAQAPMAGQASPVQVVGSGPQPIFLLALEDFATGLEEGQLSRWLLDARNVAAHGA